MNDRNNKSVWRVGGLAETAMTDPFNLVRNGIVQSPFPDVSSTSSTSLQTPINSLCNAISESLPSSSSGMFMQSSNEIMTSTNDATLTTLLIGNILEAMSMQDDTKDKRFCTCGDGIRADSYCHDCKENLCSRCVSAHYRVTLTKDHVIVKVYICMYSCSKKNIYTHNIHKSIGV